MNMNREKLTISIIVFENFEPLDVFGPVEVFGKYEQVEMRFISMDGGLVKARTGVEVNTSKWNIENFEDILLVPGGQGTRMLVNNEDFISLLRKFIDKSEYCLSVCTGSALLAKTGALNGITATSNKRAMEWVTSVGADVNWKKKARWCKDGKYYTSSGVSAGIDMALSFMADLYGKNLAENIANQIEYIWNSNSNDDPFA